MRIPESSYEFAIPQMITKLRTDTLKWVRRAISLYPVNLSPKPAELSAGRAPPWPVLGTSMFLGEDTGMFAVEL